MIAAQPYIELARSALKVYLVNPDKITLSTNESGNGYPILVNNLQRFKLIALVCFIRYMKGTHKTFF